MLNFLGKGSAFNPKLGNTSAYINYGDEYILIDCGGTVFSKIMRENLFEKAKKVYIVITHTHGDHIGSLGDLILYLYHMKNINAVIIYPNKHKIQSILKLLGVNKDLYVVNNGKKITVGLENKKVQMEWIKTNHTSVLNSFAYLFYFAEKKHQVYYSGDSKEIPKNIIEMFKIGKIDQMYQDVSSIKSESHPHLFIGDLKDIFEEKDMRKKIYCMHLDEYIDENKIRNLGFNTVETI